MRIVVLLFTLCIFSQTNFAQTTKTNLPASAETKPIRYFGHLELNGLIPLKTAPVPNHLAFEAKYWFNKTPILKSGVGLGWQMGFNEGYAKQATNFSIDGLVGKELSYLYNYLSVRYKFIQGQKKMRPYAEVGGGWLLLTDKFVDRPFNPDYDPNHTCPDGPAEYLRHTTLIRAQNRIAIDAEIGLNYYLSNKISLNLGLSSILTNPIDYLKKGYQPVGSENGLNSVAQSYNFRKRALHSTSLKIGIALLLFNDPNIIREKSNDDCFLIDDFDSSDSCN